MRTESPFLGRFTADTAIARYLRLKHGATPGSTLQIAGDEAYLGEADLISYQAGDPMTLYDRKAPGSHCFIANGAIAKGAVVSTAAAGKVQTGAAGVVDIGRALTETTGDNQVVEVLLD